MRALPIHDVEHVERVMRLFRIYPFDNDIERARARQRIIRKARDLGIYVEGWRRETMVMGPYR